jgi:hypothetical protein
MLLVGTIYSSFINLAQYILSSRFSTFSTFPVSQATTDFTARILCHYRQMKQILMPVRYCETDPVTDDPSFLSDSK